jgi:hypothetical protein
MYPFCHSVSRQELRYPSHTSSHTGMCMFYINNEFRYGAALGTVSVNKKKWLTYVYGSKQSLKGSPWNGEVYKEWHASFTCHLWMIIIKEGEGRWKTKQQASVKSWCCLEAETCVQIQTEKGTDLDGTSAYKRYISGVVWWRVNFWQGLLEIDYTYNMFSPL